MQRNISALLAGKLQILILRHKNVAEEILTEFPTPFRREKATSFPRSSRDEDEAIGWLIQGAETCPRSNMPRHWRLDPNTTPVESATPGELRKGAMLGQYSRNVAHDAGPRVTDWRRARRQRRHNGPTRICRRASKAYGHPIEEETASTALCRMFLKAPELRIPPRLLLPRRPVSLPTDGVNGQSQPAPPLREDNTADRRRRRDGGGIRGNLLVVARCSGLCAREGTFFGSSPPKLSVYIEHWFSRLEWFMYFIV